MSTIHLLRKSLILLSVFSIVSCEQNFLTLADEATQHSEIEKNHNEYQEVDQELWRYYEAFEREAAKRNISIDLNDLEITGAIEEIAEDGVAGTCQYGRHIHHVTIDQSFWDRSSAWAKEMVVFHELGHCVLDRGHKEDKDQNGSCLSIMHSGTTNCLVRYNSDNKDYYLDELFLGD